VQVAASQGDSPRVVVAQRLEKDLFTQRSLERGIVDTGT